MTTLAKIRVKIKGLEEDVRIIKKEFESVVQRLANNTNPLGKKEKDDGNS
jgi:hypothetical protein